MGKGKVHSWWLILGVLLPLVLPLATASGQEINLDKFEKCGDLLCYQSLKDSSAYYYLPDQPRLAIKDGRPQFSFLKYARTRETGEAGTGRAEGGGIVHFLVTYGAEEGRVKAAEESLQEKYPQAKIAGPVIYRKGSFALITSFKKGQETLTRMVAVGKAPLMEGQKAAVSMALTREGAELLWESFKSATPDISLVFDMIFVGVRQPYEAKLEADWKRVANHQRVKAGLKYAWFGADVDMLFQELRQTGAVKITTKGQDANLDKILQSANNKLLKVMFDPAPVDELTRAAAEKDSYSNLNQAIKMLKDTATTRTKSEGRSSVFYDTPSLFANFGLENVSTRNEPFDNSSVLNLLISTAYAADDSKQMQEAIELFKKAEKVRKEGRYSDAIKLYEQVNGLHRAAKGYNSLGAVFNLGFCYYRLENWDPALRNFQEFLDLLPKNPNQEKLRGEAYAFIGSCMQALGRNDEILDYLKKAEEDPSGNSADVLNIIADTHFSMGSYGQAAYYFKKALSNAQSGSEAYRYASRKANETAAKAYNHARKLDGIARGSNYETEATQNALNAYLEYQDNVVPTGQRAQEVESRVQYLSGKLEQSGAVKEVVPGKDYAVTGNVPATNATGQKTNPSEKSAGIKQSASVPRTSSKKTPPKKTTSPAKRTKKGPKRQAVTSRENGAPGFSLVASYQMKNIKRSGRIVYHMNHYRSESQAFAMAENIGDLYRRYGNDPRIFRAVNIDDPVFKQREILVTLDGQDAASFGKHMNFVTVQMKKIHQSGEVTTDEVVITPEKFNQSSNAFALSYGWKGDDDRTSWLAYKIQTLWSFHGGVDIRTDWKTYDGAMLALQPPHRYRTITVEGEGYKLIQAKVRHAVITVTSKAGGKSVVTQGTIRNRGPAPTLILEVPENRESLPREVSITWHLEGGKTVSSPARPVEGDIVYWDELPEKEV